MPEQETVDYFTVRVGSWGDPEKLHAEHLRNLCRQLHVSFGPVMLQDKNGRWWRWSDTDRDEQGSKGCLVECYPPDLKLGQKPFKPKPLSKPRANGKKEATIHMLDG